MVRLGKRFNYLENWTAITNYKENDVVKYGGTVYICLTAHTSDTVTNGLEQDLTKWAVYNRSDFWKGVWQVNTRYVKDDVVRFGGNVYLCNGHLQVMMVLEKVLVVI